MPKLPPPQPLRTSVDPSLTEPCDALTPLDFAGRPGLTRNEARERDEEWLEVLDACQGKRDALAHIIASRNDAAREAVGR